MIGPVPVNKHGAGVYGRENTTIRHVCGRCRNPFSREGRADCPNAPKTAPETGPVDVFPPSPYEVIDDA